MESGCAQFQGNDVGKAIDLYYAHFANNEANVVLDDGTIVLENVEILDACYENKIPQLNWGDDLKLKFRFTIKDKNDCYKFTVTIFDKEQRPVAILKPNIDKLDVNTNANFVVKHKNLQLSKGVYSINIVVSNMRNNEPLLRINGVITFQVIHYYDTWPPFLLNSSFEKIE